MITNVQIMYEDLNESIKGAIAYVEDLSCRQLLYPLIDSMISHVRSVLIGLLKEGVSLSTVELGPNAEDEVECSIAAQTVIHQVPEMMKSHLLSLPKTTSVVAATEELCLRILTTYVSIASLLRPVNELSRLRTAKDMAAIEALVLPYCTTGASISGGSSCPVMKEFKAFRQLLFSEDAPANSNTKASSTNNTKNNSNNNNSTSSITPAPSRSRILSLPFISSLRPSTLLGHLISCAPPQLPSPHDNGNNNPVNYFEVLTHPSPSKTYMATKGDGLSIRSLYSSNGDWRGIESEVFSWESIQECLDIFLQRAGVADPITKTSMRAWYESLMDIGGQYYGNVGPSVRLDSLTVAEIQ